MFFAVTGTNDILLSDNQVIVKVNKKSRIVSVNVMFYGFYPDLFVYRKQILQTVSNIFLF